MIDTKQYAERDPVALDKAGGYFFRHLSAMTGEGLHSKAAIACELAFRDAQIDTLVAELAKSGDDNNNLLLMYQLTRTQRDALAAEVAELRGRNAGVPWRQGALGCWALCGMNHYHVAGQRYLFVSMTRRGRCIVAEGPDGPGVWEQLQAAAKAHSGQEEGDAV